MAFNNAPGSPPIDEDISRTVENILKAAIAINDNDKVYSRLVDSLSVAMQVERNGWKYKLQSTLHEIDRQHRASITVQASLQELVDTLCIVPLLHSPHSDGRQSSDLISGLQNYIQDLQDAVTRATRDSNIESKLKKMQDSEEKSKENQLESKLKEMQVSLVAVEKEKGDHVATIKEKTKEITWLQKELNAIKNQLHKLRRIVLNYNESHSTKFHLDDVELPKDGELTGGHRGAMISRERTYVEGDQLEYFATPGEEIALWKLRAKQNVPDSRRGNVRTGIAQCLRCQQLFKSNENNAMACRYHKKGREIREQYDNSGRLSKVMYKWACCKRNLDVAGCTYGYHI
ncbi:uncharacterized protein [Littorina saxatilis]|uniref:uncharacterized protein n=1 Tax=Littorina saxatilis TaxID=31220 RepID=UPI0038B5E537